MEGLDFAMGDYEGQLHIFSKTEMFIFFSYFIPAMLKGI